MNFELEEEHELDILENLFDYIDIDGPTNEQMTTIYDVFKKDIINDPLIIKTKQVGYDKRKSIHPLFRNKPVGFEHICTRQSKHKSKRRRDFDPERTNRIHWIKPIIQCNENARVKYFEREHANGQNQQYYWLRQSQYVVIIREITVKLQLVTAFKVDKTEENRFKKWYAEYNK